MLKIHSVFYIKYAITFVIYLKFREFDSTNFERLYMQSTVLSIKEL